MQKQTITRFAFLLCALSLLLCGQAFADGQSFSNAGWYAGLEAGVSLPHNSSVHATNSGGVSGCILSVPGVGCLFPSSGSGSASTRYGNRFDLGYAVGGTVGYQTTFGLRPEVEIHYMDSGYGKTKLEQGYPNNGVSVDSKGDLGTLALMGNLWYDFPLSKHIHPYVGGGAGYARFAVNDFRVNGGPGQLSDTDYEPVYQIGGGIDIPLTDRVTASLGYRYFSSISSPQYNYQGETLKTSGFTTNIAQLGLRYTFAAAGQQAKDSDHDGVPNSQDQCPNTPEGVSVDAKGCPLDSDQDGVPDYKDQCPNTPHGAAVDANGCPLDSDHDGVPDYKDQCPNTPAGTQVNAQGCPLHKDSDHDGVPDSRDKCPNTPKGAKVMANGCAINQKFTLRGVTFNLNKATLTPNAERVLDYVAETLKDSPGFGVQLNGYTDSTGTKAYNLGLSRRRAASAKKYLVSQGVASDRIKTKGYGEADPVASNKTASGRQLNRRIELKVISSGDNKSSQ